MKRGLVILAVVVLLGVLSLFSPLVGFRYSVAVDNLASECPNTVVGVDGPRVTLDDGRVLVVQGAQVGWLATELKECENRVRFDASERTLYTMRRVAFCGSDRPESRQLITVPLKRVELRQYASREFAAAHEVRPAGAR
jgi:hypothetical protein